MQISTNITQLWHPRTFDRHLASAASGHRGRATSGWPHRCALDDLFEDLSAPRGRTRGLAGICARRCLDHPLCDLLHQDPFTYRAFSKPRGYAGDAVMMDYIYGLGEADRRARRPRRWAARFSGTWTRVLPRGRSGTAAADRGPDRPRGRSGGDRACSRWPPATCEKWNCPAPSRRPEVAEVRGDRPGRSEPRGGCTGLRAFRRDRQSGSVRQILAGKVNPGQFDFVYAAGLFDYLSAPVSRCADSPHVRNDAAREA